jgi:molybdopterin-guanine dinucleotide biosynthesis protein A
MGGGDKPLRTLGGRTLLERAVARLQPQCDGLILNANGDPTRFAPCLPVVPDDVPGFAGPLAGILAALDWAAANRPDLATSSAPRPTRPFCPATLFPASTPRAKAPARRWPAPSPGGQAHPVNALWPVALRENLRRALLDEGLRKIDRWTARHGVALAAWPTEPVDPFFNANTPEDLAEAERLLALHGGD